MAVVRLWLGAELRRRWRSHAVLALLIGIVGAVILTVGAGARRTASAYDRYIDRQSIPTVEMDSTPDEARAAVAALPGVKAAAAYSVAFAAPAREGVLPGQDAVAFAAVDPGYGHTIDRPIVVSGRLPRIGAADEAAVNESAAAAYHLRPGSVTSLRSMAADEGEAMFAGRFDKVTFHGPTPAVRVVGVVRSRLDLGHVSYARNYLFTTPAFAAAYREQMFFYPPQLDVRLADPAKADRFLAAAHDTVAAMSPDHRVGEFSGRPVSPGLTSIRDSTRVQALALGILAVLHALLVSARRRDHQVGILRALGFTRGQVVGAVSAQGAAMCILGVLIGVPLGIALGRWTWALSAHQLGVGERAVVPSVVIAAVLGGGLGLLLALGASAGWWAGRSTPSSALRVP